MAKLIRDVKPHEPEVPSPKFMHEMSRRTDAQYVKHVDYDILIAELHHRGVGVHEVFAQYYEMEAIADARSDEAFGNDEQGQHGLTVADAELAGFTQPVTPKPF